MSLIAEVASAFVSLVPSARGFGKATAQVIDGDMVKAGKSGGSKLTGALSGVLTKGSLAVGVAAGGILGTALFKGFERLSAIDQAKAKLTGLGNSTKAVNTIMTNALASVKGTAFGLGDAATVAASAVAAGIKPGKALEANLRLVADAATIGGTSLSEMGAVFNKVAASNKIQGDTINQLNDMGIPIVQLLGKEMGKTASEVTDLASEGKIGFKTFSKAMEAGLGGSALKSGETFKGALANVGAALGRVGASLLTGLFPIAKQVFAGITTFLDNVTAKVGPMADAFAAKLPGAFEAVGAAIGKVDFAAIGAKLSPLVDAIKGFVSSVIDAGAKAAPALLSIVNSLAPLAKLAIGAALVGLTAAFQSLGPAVEHAASAFVWITNLVANNQTTFAVIAGVIMASLVPAFIAWGVQATIAAAKNVAAWVSSKAGAVASAAMQIVSLTLIAAGWLASGVRAMAGAVVQAAAWVVARVASIPTIAAYAAAFAFMGASWLASGVRAMAGAVVQVAAWLLSKLAIAGTIVLYGVAFAMMAAGWIASGVAAMAGAVAMAAAWVIALGPIGLAIAAIVAVVAIVVLNWDKIKAATVAVWNAIKSAISTAVNAVKAVITTVFNAIKSYITGVVNTWKSIITTVWNAIKSVVTSVVNGVKSAISTAFNAAKSVVTSVMNAIKSVVSTGITNVVGFFKDLPGKIKGALSGAAGWLVGIGKDIVNGLISGIGKMAGSVMDALLNLIPGPLKKFAGALGINSPSTVFRAFGLNIGEGLVIGVDKSRSDVTAASARLASSVAMPKGARFDMRASQASSNSTPTASSGSAFDGLLAAMDENTAQVIGLRKDIRALPKDYQMGQRQGVR